MTPSGEFQYFIFDTETAIGLEEGILKLLASHQAKGLNKKFLMLNTKIKSWNNIKKGCSKSQ